MGGRRRNAVRRPRGRRRRRQFNDADLIGLPVRLVVSPRNLRQDAVELRGRTAEDAEMAALDDVVDAVRRTLNPE